jgi:hypothetical protein
MTNEWSEDREARFFHGCLDVDEALLEQQARGAVVQLFGQHQHLLQLGHGEVRVVELQLFDEDAEHVAQAGELKARRDGLHMPVVGCHRGLEVAWRAVFSAGAALSVATGRLPQRPLP